MQAYATNRPLGELVALALNILDARWSGVADEVPATPAVFTSSVWMNDAQLAEAAASGDLAAALQVPV